MELPTQEQEGTSDFDSYDRLVSSNTFGIVRMYRARVVSHTAFIALGTYSSIENPPPELRMFAEHCQLGTISAEDVDAFRYVTNISALVYGTAVFDTFLSDTTRFLLFKFPKSLGALSLDFNAVLASPSREVLIGEIIDKKIRTLAFDGFDDRIKYLKQTFGLRIDVEEEVASNLTHYATLRNVIAHDQGVHTLELDQEGRIKTNQTRCGRHPTIVQDHDVRDAWKAYRDATRIIYEAVVGQVLKASDHPQAQKVINWLRHET